MNMLVQEIASMTQMQAMIPYPFLSKEANFRRNAKQHVTHSRQEDSMSPKEYHVSVNLILAHLSTDKQL